MPYFFKQMAFLLLLFSPALNLLPAQGACIDPQQIDNTAACPGVEEPVCGCDGITYPNACQAENWYGVTDWSPGPCPPVCEASFLYTFLDDSTAVFYNSSANFSGYEWIINGEAVNLPDSTLSFTYTFNSDTNLVCLLVWNDAGCQDVECQAAYRGAPEEMCNVTDCVWPGDANGDGRANHYDLLNIGLGFGIPGPERPFFPDESDPISWLPNFGPDWQDWAGPVNFKHLDCDGDGFIDAMDVDAISHNYTPDFDFTSSPVAGAPPVYLEFEEPVVYVNQDSTSLIELNANLYLGTEAAPFTGLHGIALFLDYPHELTASNSIVVEYDNNSFFGDANDVLAVSQDLNNYNLGRYDLAFSHKNDNGASGFGKVARLSFIVSADIIEGRVSTDTPYTVGLDGVLLIDFDGNPLEYSNPGSATTIIIETATTDDDEEEAAEAFEVFPNPASTTLFLQFGSRPPERLELANALGQAVWQRPAAGPSMEIDVSSLKPGLYILNAYAKEGVGSKRVLVK